MLGLGVPGRPQVLVVLEGHRVCAVDKLIVMRCRRKFCLFNMSHVCMMIHRGDVKRMGENECDCGWGMMDG